ncbi:hypothetical protein [Kitasatospora sp. CB01950]|uniref:hypothetical protein n=1 Tax=Kitasatospora sp. CB01950 TaxID=1703930 RepID=UPI00094020BE|nr:hypothetical protein [Kitasatospora sp. CB01950]OKI95094.1 hypothetical protein AMK19_33020 [Kitasatospora sp. CB01950]
MNSEETAERAASAVDTVLDQMDAGQKPNAADVLVVNVALFAAEREGIQPESWQKHLRARQ